MQIKGFTKSKRESFSNHSKWQKVRCRFKVFKNKNTLTLLIYSIIFTIINPIRPSGSFFSTWSAATYWVIIGVLLYFLVKDYNKKKIINNNLH